MAGGERERPRRHLKPVRKGESIGREAGIGGAGAISWSTTWAALVVSVGLTVFLTTLGLEFNVGGLAGADVSFLGAFWIGATLTLALFAGGYFLSISRSSPTLTRAALHGLVLWGLFVSIAVLLAAVSNPVALRFARIKFSPQSLTAVDGITAIFILLMLGAAILGTIVGTYQFSRR